jgi:hypothetical protein
LFRHAIVVLTTPAVHEVVTVPPELDDATTRSKAGERMANERPVELDSVTITLVALTSKPSAAESVAIVRFVAGELSETVSAVLKERGAASVTPLTRQPNPARATRTNVDRCEGIVRDAVIVRHWWKTARARMGLTLQV